MLYLNNTYALRICAFVISQMLLCFVRLPVEILAPREVSIARQVRLSFTETISHYLSSREVGKVSTCFVFKILIRILEYSHEQGSLGTTK